MIFYYLIVVILLVNGSALTTPARPFPTSDECFTAGRTEGQRIRDDMTIKQGAWRCDAVDFDMVDPLPVPLRRDHA